METPIPKLSSTPSKGVDINLLHYVFVCCDLYLKLEGVTIEKSNQATLSSCEVKVAEHNF